MRWWSQKIGHFGRQLCQTFLSDISVPYGNNIIPQEGDKIKSDTNEICETFNTYFISVASNNHFDDSIPPDFYMEDVIFSFGTKALSTPMYS